MGSHGKVNSGPPASDPGDGTLPKATDFTGSRILDLQNWPVSRRLFAVISLTLVMGLVFGGLRVASAAGSAAQFSRVSQLARLGQQITLVTQDLQDERDRTCGTVPVRDPGALQHSYDATDAAAVKVQSLVANVGGSFPAQIRTKAAAVRSALSNLPQLRYGARNSTSALLVIADYSVPIDDLLALNGQIALGADDPALTSDVQTLNSLSLEKDQVAQQRAILYNALTKRSFANAEQQALVTAVAGQGADATAFDATATPAEQSSFNRAVAGPAVKQALNIEQYVDSTGSLDIGAGALNISAQAAPGQWYAAMSATIGAMQQVELRIAGNVVARARVLQRGAEQAALVTSILTAAVLVLVLLAAFAVARSLVLPLRRLREGALDIATVQLPERVRQLGESPDSVANLEGSPIDVLTADEIGQVARAFDQVHAEAMRLAGNEALLRGSFNAMFVSLSRRSQSLIERLAQLIDSLEQAEEDPGRLSNLFTMDHLVTRMRRNSENLLLLAGHEGTRKWSEPVPLTDVIRAALSEIEQYSRVTLNVQPGILVPGRAVSDIVHLLAELVENATVFSASGTPVGVSAQELSRGGVLIEISDSGVGVSAERLAELNQRLDDPPAIDVSVSRHMGLFAVARLAERHGVRTQLRARTPQGLTALVWLPGTLIEREARQYDRRQLRPTPQLRGHLGPATAGDAPVAYDWFRNPRQPDGAVASGPVPGVWAEGQYAAQIVTDPVRADRTVAGMPVRVPRANLIPGSVGGRPHRDARPATGDRATAAATPRPQSAEGARSRLAGFQRGARRAEGRATSTDGGRADS